MANVQRGDVKQVFTQTVSKPADFSPVVNSVNNLINTGISVQQMADESKMANYQINLANEALELNTKINTKYQADPTNPEREREFQEGFSLLADKYKVSAVSQGKWGQIKNGILNNYKTYNTKWQIQQQQTNAQVDLKNGYEALNNQISMLGRNGASYDEIKLTYNNGISALKKGAYAVLGEVTTEYFLKDANHDFMSSYISSLANTNALEAQRLMKDQGVLNDIGNAQTIEKLNDYIASSLQRQHQKHAVAELGDSLRKLGSEEANNLLNGSADFRQVTSFIENNKNLPETSKEMLLGIYGISSTTKYKYNKDTGRIEAKSEGGSSLGNLKLSEEQKQLVAQTLEQDLHNMLSFSDEQNELLNIKNLKTPDEKTNAQSAIIGRMQMIAAMQGSIDTALASGAITKDQRKKYINDYILPAADYVENALSQFDEKQAVFGQKLGYDNIRKEFNTKDLDGEELKAMQMQKLQAQNYYLDELYSIVQKSPKLKSIYDIESLTPERQREIYKTASDRALKRTKRWTDRPETFFAKEYPEVYSIPFQMYGQNKALEINRNVAKEMYKRTFGTEELSDKELGDLAKQISFDKINKEAQLQARKAGELLLGDISATLASPDPKNYSELVQQLNSIGYTIKDFEKFADEEGYVNKGYDLWKGYMSKGHLQALRDLKRANSIKRNK